MDEMTRALLEHGVLGIIVVLQMAVIGYLFREVRRLNDRMFELLAKVEAQRTMT